MTDETKKDPLAFLREPGPDQVEVTEIWERDEAGELHFVGYKLPGEPVVYKVKV